MGDKDISVLIGDSRYITSSNNRRQLWYYYIKAKLISEITMINIL